MKNINMAKISLIVFTHAETQSVTIQGNITVIGLRTDVIRSVLLNIHANFGMMLVRD